MPQMIRDAVEISHDQPLDCLIAQLTGLRERLPQGAMDARIRAIGDDVFGRRLSVSFLRPMTMSEEKLAMRYSMPIAA